MGQAKKKLAKKKEQKNRKETPSLYNRRARYDFEILDTLQAGLVLQGTEIRSIRLGRGHLAESFVKINKVYEVYLYGMTIPRYEFGNLHNHDPHRVRKLLLHKKQIKRWQKQVEKQKLTIIPLRLYFRQAWAKLEIALAKRKLQHDKRKELKEKSVQMEVKRALKEALS